MRHLLLVAYHFPPAGGVPVRRVLRFLRHLPEHGWRCSVLTADAPYDPFHPEDPGGVGRVPPLAHLVRAPARSGPERALAALWRAVPKRGGGSSEPGAEVSGGGLRRLVGDRLFFPDPKRGWARGAVTEARALASRDAFDLVLATGYPWSSFRVAHEAGRHAGVPVVLDYRDAWTANPRRIWDTPRQAALEGRLVRGSALVTAATDWIRDDLVDRFAPACPVETITNGFDPEEWPADDPGLRDPDHVVLTYTGSFNDAWPPSAADQSPWHVLHAIRRLGPEVRARLRVRFVGRGPKGARAFCGEHGLDPTVSFVGAVPHARALQYQRASDALLLVVSGAPGAEGILTGKLVEYAGAGRPVLAVAPEASEAARMVRDEGLGAVVSPPADVSAIRVALEALASEGAGALGRSGQAGPERLSARAQIERLASLLHAAAALGTPAAPPDPGSS
jgi:glycosyltransferase involved in cell wall biosynthesis